MTMLLEMKDEKALSMHAEPPYKLFISYRITLSLSLMLSHWVT